MNELAQKRMNQKRRANRVRIAIAKNGSRPRLSVHVSNMHVTAQIIDDTKGGTLAYATSVGQKIEGTMTDKAAWVGKEIAVKAKKAKIGKVTFDRGGKIYHGRLKVLAGAAREGGLEF